MSRNRRHPMSKGGCKPPPQSGIVSGLLYGGFRCHTPSLICPHGDTSFNPTSIDNQDNITGFNPNNLNIYPHQPYLGFMLNGPTLTTYAYYNPPAIAVPNDPLADPNSTFATGIQQFCCEIVGYYLSGNHAHGFIYQSGTFTTVDAPGAIDTHLNAINNNGEIVGLLPHTQRKSFPQRARPDL